MAAGGAGAGGGGNKWRPGGDGDGPGGPGHGPRAEWMPGRDGPRRRPPSNRGLKIALGVALLAIVAAIYYVVTIPREPDSPPLIVVAADPALDGRALTLSTPVDPYGWQAGDLFEKKLEEFRGSGVPNKALVPKVGRVDQLATADQLAGQAVEKCRGEKFALVYFGLHTGADAGGPFLYTDKGKTLPVKELLDKLAEKAPDTQLVVLFDPARLPPRPELGRLTDDFVRRMKELPLPDRVTVVLGCDEGQRGWESEEWGGSAFARSVARGLAGGATSATGSGILTAPDLFAFVQDDLKAWTEKNRPTPQNAVILPAWKKGESHRADGLQVGPAGKGAAGTEADAVGKAQEGWAGRKEKLGDRWKAYAGLSGGKLSPAVYTPRRWRRYRELLLRYEYLARAGSGAAERLERHLVEEEAALAAAVKPPLGKSWTAAASLWGQNPDRKTAVPDGLFAAPPDKFKEAVALNRTEDARMAYSADVIDRLTNDTSRSRTNFDARPERLRLVWEGGAGGGLVRPPEVQLALMLGRFYDDRPPVTGEERGLVREPLPVGTKGAGPPVWQTALRVRRLAEEAAVGWGRRLEHPYSEAVWRFVRADIEKADDDRRQGEDHLFGPAADGSHERAAAFLDAADKKYQAAARAAEQVRGALAARDEVAADLPFLARWLAAEGSADNAAVAAGLWARVHDLTDGLDRPTAKPAELAAAAAELMAAYQPVKAAYTDQFAKGQEPNKRTQRNWAEREQLLAVPPLDGADAPAVARLGMIGQNHETAALLAGPDAGTPDDRRPPRPPDVALRLGRAAAGELGLGRERGPYRSAAAADGRKLLPAAADGAALRDEVERISGDGWADQAAAAGGRLAAVYRALADAPDPVATDAPDTREAAEAVARAVGGRDAAGDEPAKLNRDLRWRELLTGLARRVALDRWYDGQAGRSEPYFFQVAEAYLDDARAIGGATLPDPRTALADLLKPEERLALAPQLPLVRWTTETRKDVLFRLSGPVPQPTARVAAWAADRLAAGVTLAPESAARRLLAPAEFAALKTTLVTPRTDTRDDPFGLGRTAFFRGQEPPATAAVRLTQAPEVIYTRADPPRDDRPQVAVFGPDDLDLGALAVVLDCSGSMGTLKDPGSRLSRALGALDAALKKVPDGTQLTVRAFGVKREGDRLDREAFETVRTIGDGRGGPATHTDGKVYAGTHDRLLGGRVNVGWRPLNPGGKPGDQHGRFIQQLRGAAEDLPEDNARLSPIVRTMLHAARDLKDDRPERKVGRRVMLVLTDGADTSTDNTPADRQKLRQALEELRTHNLVVRMLLLTDADNKGEVGEVENQFKESLKIIGTAGPSGGTDEPESGLEVLQGTAGLAQKIADLLRPKVWVKPVDGGAAAVRVPLKYDAPAAAAEYEPGWSRDRLPAGPGQHLAAVGRVPVLDEAGSQRLHLAAGDRLLVKVARGASPRDPPAWQRLLWADLLKADPRDERRSAGQAKAGSWLLTAVQYRTELSGLPGEGSKAAGRQVLDTLFAVENTRHPAAGEPVRQDHPAFVWWALAPGGEARTPRQPLYVWPEYGHPAPAWRLRKWEWKAGGGPPPAEFRGWVVPADRLGSPAARTTPTAAGGGWAGQLPDRREWTATFEWEKGRKFVTGPQTEQVRDCLAVRVYLPPWAAGRPDGVFVRVAGATLEEHRYFPDAGAYTGYFAGGEAFRNPSDGWAVELFSLADITRAGGAEGGLNLLPPTDRSYSPEPINYPPR